MIFGTYVHDLNPVLLKITEAIQLRWYGLAYLAGFMAGFYLLKHLSGKGRWVVAADKVSDFITYAAIFGVFLGGRIGYVLFYMIPEKGIGYVLSDPLTIIKVWDGGMASHGGFLGLMVYCWYYARKQEFSWADLGDGLCAVAPLGLFFGRMANFINGELFGRVAEGHAWLMKFPSALFTRGLAEVDSQQDALMAAAQVDPAVNSENLIAQMRANPAVESAVEPFLLARHPSQLYEAILEGLVLFVILWWVKNHSKRRGLVTGLFFVLYAVFRTFVEAFREPDSEMILMFTKGQFYSLFMVLIGIGFLCMKQPRKE